MKGWCFSYLYKFIETISITRMEPRISMNKDDRHQSTHSSEIDPFWGPRWLVEERDACGVGFIAQVQGTPSHHLIRQALTALGCMEHRGGCSADYDSGDGSGVMTAIPIAVLAPWFSQNQIAMPAPGQLGVGMVFLPQDPSRRQESKAYIEECVRQTQLQLLGWREVPVRPEVLGRQARENQPHIEQVLVTDPDDDRAVNSIASSTSPVPGSAND
jgi:glutamate synthase (ferredoxin)